MAVVSTLSNHYKYMKMTKQIDFANDTFKIILMNTSFAFNKDTHATLADVTASQLTTGNGYTQNDKALVLDAVSEDDDEDAGIATFEDPAWAASGGDIGPTGAAVIYDDTTADDTVVGCIDFGVDVTVADGTGFSIQSIQVDEG